MVNIDFHKYNFCKKYIPHKYNDLHYIEYPEQNIISDVFDEIYFITLVERIDRVRQVIYESRKFLEQDKIKICYTCMRKFTNEVGKHFFENDKVYKNFPNSFGPAYNCLMNHYRIVKTAYLRGLKNILICEDDIIFIKNIDIINWTFANMPKKYCCCKFRASKQRYDNNVKIQRFSKGDFKHKEYGTLCYALDREGMKKYIDSVDKHVLPADVEFIEFLDDIYVVDIPLCYQNDNFSTIV